MTIDFAKAKEGTSTFLGNAMKLAKTLVMGFFISQAAWAQDNWPGSPKVGIRAGVAGSTGTAGIDAGNVGLKALLSDKVALVVDFGLNIQASGSATSASFALGRGANLYLNEPTSSLRPYIPVFLGFGVIGTPAIQTQFGTIGGDQVFQMGLGAGLGAEYFVSKQFSISADLIMGVTFTRFDPFTVKIATVTPGVQVAYYF